MDKKTLTIVAVTAVATLILANKLRGLPGVNKLPTV
jgi:hypothetical protein